MPHSNSFEYFEPSLCTDELEKSSAQPLAEITNLSLEDLECARVREYLEHARETTRKITDCRYSDIEILSATFAFLRLISARSVSHWTLDIGEAYKLLNSITHQLTCQQYAVFLSRFIYSKNMCNNVHARSFPSLIGYAPQRIAGCILGVSQAGREKESRAGIDTPAHDKIIPLNRVEGYASASISPNFHSEYSFG